MPISDAAGLGAPGAPGGVPAVGDCQENSGLPVRVDKGPPPPGAPGGPPPPSAPPRPPSAAARPRPSPRPSFCRASIAACCACRVCCACCSPWIVPSHTGDKILGGSLVFTSGFF